MTTDNKIVFLRSKKTLLRPLGESDLPLITRWINDPDITKYLTVTFPTMLHAEKKWLEGLADKKNEVVLGICKLDGTLIGVMGVHDIKWVDRTATTGAFIGEKRYWNKGYGSDAKMALLGYIFNTLNLRKVSSKVYAFNGRSIAYSKRCGYKVEGTLKKHVFREGEYHDIVELAVFKEDWLPYWRKHVGKKG